MGETNRIPQYLEPLLDGTPLAMEKIKAAWPGLAISDRAFLLSTLLPKGSQETFVPWKRQRDDLMDLALGDDNPYIRYLSARHVESPKAADASSRARYEKIRSDESDLVRSAPDEGSLSWKFGFLSDQFGRFWKLPHVSRLALVNGDQNSIIADSLRYASKELLPNGSVNVDEMLDVLLQFLGPEFVREIGVPNRQRVPHSLQTENDSWLAGIAEQLWKLVPDVPELLSYVLLSCLPEPACSPVPPDIVDALDNNHLKFLLGHNEISLKELRRKVFTESSDPLLREAAVSSQKFALLDSDISRLVLDPAESQESVKSKMEELAILAEASRGATLVQLEAISDLADQPGAKSAGYDGGSSYYAARENQRRRAKNLPPVSLEREVLEMRIYQLARILTTAATERLGGEDASMVQSDFRDLPESLQKHLQCATPSNPWSTYLNLCKTVSAGQWKRGRADLPQTEVAGLNLPE
jgi:hypothetical protein